MFWVKYFLQLPINSFLVFVSNRFNENNDPKGRFYSYVIEFFRNIFFGY